MQSDSIFTAGIKIGYNIKEFKGCESSSGRLHKLYIKFQ